MRRRAAGVIGCVFALALGVGAAGAHAAPKWGQCPAPAHGPPLDPRQRCATVSVPLDHAAPNGPRIEIAISRVRAGSAERRRGVLLFNPGGPGGSGLDLPTVFADVMPRQVTDRYDLIGFDPRGIGRSAGATCGLTPAQQDITRFLPWPTLAGFPDSVAYARGAADACERTAGATNQHVTTANTARDMDAIREALQERAISYWGVSYGTYLGAVYATLFPKRTDRVVLDSVVDPRSIWRGAFRSWAAAGEQRFGDFTAWAAQRDADYGLGGSPGAVREAYLALAARLDREPVEVQGVPLTGNLLRTLTWQSMYSDLMFADLAALMRDVRAGKKVTARLLSLMMPPADEPPAGSRSLPDPPADNAFAGPWSVLCGDTRWPTDPAIYERDAAADGARYPIFGAMASNIWPCAFWHREPRERPVAIAPLRRDASVLLVQGRRDPATPYQGAVAMRHALGDRARLVSADVGGHGVTYDADGQRCANGYATAYLATGELPASDVECAREKLASTPALRARAREDARRRAWVP